MHFNFKIIFRCLKKYYFVYFTTIENLNKLSLKTILKDYVNKT